MKKRHNPPATAYVASVWERVTATVCAVGILIVVVIIILDAVVPSSFAG